eukprot:gene20365-27131_t
MRRRLSVALSLLGRPAVVFLDEPSTGLDPASRMVLWKAIRAAKEHSSIVLTSHSLVEAEALCDRLGIFVGGRLRCIGNPKISCLNGNQTFELPNGDVTISQVFSCLMDIKSEGE